MAPVIGFLWQRPSTAESTGLLNFRSKIAICHDLISKLIGAAKSQLMSRFHAHGEFLPAVKTRFRLNKEEIVLFATTEPRVQWGIT
jgi:hypothetical protein